MKKLLSRPASICLGLIFFVNTATPSIADASLAGEYRGLYAFCKKNQTDQDSRGVYPCSEDDFKKAERKPEEKNNNIGLKLWQENGEWKAIFTPPTSWKNFHEPKEARSVTIGNGEVGFQVDRPYDQITLKMEGHMTADGILEGRIDYRSYIMHGKLKRY